jgi:hypothetical protein
VRLDRHGLATSRADGLVDVVGAMCGAHAQVMSAAELSVGLRMSAGTRVAVRDALWVDRELVKTYGPRGTVHLLPARDLPMWTVALSSVPRSANQFSESVRLTPDQHELVVDAIGRALTGVELTVDELGDAVVGEVGAWAGDLVMPAFGALWPRWRQAVTDAAYRGVLCFGADRGRKVTYTNPLVAAGPSTEVAVAELLRRYLYAYGPATPYQFAQWLAAPRRWAVEVFESADWLVPVELDGAVAWLAADDVVMPAEPPSGLRLLPYFDAYVVGSHPRELLFPGSADRALANGQAGTFPVVLVDGVVAGVWHQRRVGRKLDVTVELSGRLTAGRRRELDEQVARVGEILEAAPRLTIGPVIVGAHK